jgi:hypothetical protein
MGHRYSLFMLFVILFSTLTFVLESMPSLQSTPAACKVALTVDNCRPSADLIFAHLEKGSIAIFSVDYVLRIATAHSASGSDCDIFPANDAGLTALRKTTLYATAWLNIIDLLALVPFYIEVAFGSGGGAGVLRVLRLIRVFRILKLPKLKACVDMFAEVMIDAFPALLILSFMTMICSIFLSACIFFAEGTTYSLELPKEEYPYGTYVRPTTAGYGLEATPFTSITYSFWWFFTTATTVGYGDDFPTSTWGRVVGILTFYTGIVLLALPVTIVSGSFGKFYPAFVKEFCELQDGDPDIRQSARMTLVRVADAVAMHRILASTRSDSQAPPLLVEDDQEGQAVAGKTSSTASGYKMASE